MNNKFEPVFQDEIDLLAEGELDGKERQRLIEKLDQDPTGWKRCALALMESQALDQSLNSLSLETQSGVLVAPAKPSGKKTDSLSRLSKTKRVISLAVAASVLLLVGFIGGNAMPHNTTKPALADVMPRMNLDDPISQMVRENDPDFSRRIQIAMDSTGVSDSEIVALVGIQSENRADIVPIIKSEQLARQLIQIRDPQIPRKLASQLAQGGWHVRSQKQFVSIVKPNGETQTLPVGMLNYHFVGRETY